MHWIDEAWNNVEYKIGKTSRIIKTDFPAMSKDGIYQNTPALWSWVVGFWPGLLWLVYEQNNDEYLKEIAIECEDLMETELDTYENIHHDVGFMWELTAIKQYKLLGTKNSRTRALVAASHLASRFNINGRYIRAWNKNDVNEANPKGLSIIDSMMNLPLLYWAANELDAPRFSHIANAHANTVLKEFVREDGSIRHMVEFDPYTGEIAKYHGGQGYNEDSAWSRGASWAIHGFALAYKYTKNDEYLKASMKAADFFINSLPNDKVPYWDFRAPIDDRTPRDTSAAACAASGMIELSQLIEGEKSKFYLDNASKIIKSLCENYATFDNDDEQGLLLGGTFNYPKGLGIDISLIYGDYYFVECLSKLKNMNRCFIWME